MPITFSITNWLWTFIQNENHYSRCKLFFGFTLIGISSLSIFKSKWSEAEYISSLGGLDHFLYRLHWRPHFLTLPYFVLQRWSLALAFYWCFDKPFRDYRSITNLTTWGSIPLNKTLELKGQHLSSYAFERSRDYELSCHIGFLTTRLLNNPNPKLDLYPWWCLKALSYLQRNIIKVERYIVIKYCCLHEELDTWGSSASVAT